MQRRDCLRHLGAAAGLVVAGRATATAPGIALPAVSEGPFYPPAAWRSAWTDWDADLTQVTHRPGGAGAQGERLGLELQVVDARGRPVDRAEVEIWQCDALAAYHHPGVARVEGRHDPAFAGFGATRSSADGWARFRTIRPVPYPGRTPHIHLKLRHPAFGERTSQLFVQGDPGNPADFLWQRLTRAQQEAVQFDLRPAAPGSDLRWTARRSLVVPV